MGGKIMKSFIKQLINLICSIVIRILNVFFKKQKDIILIGGWFGQRFADNSKYLFLYLNENKIKYRLNKIIFVTRNKKIYNYIKNELRYETCMMYSLKSFYYHLVAKFYIIDQSPRKDLLGYLGINSIKINLWHGFPLKKIGYEKSIKKVIQLGNWQNAYLLTCSEFGSSILGEAFKCFKDRRLKGMYPRNHYLLNCNKYLDDREKSIIEKIEIAKKNKKKILMYLPTFRDKEKLKFLGVESEERIIKFFKFLQSNDYFLISKVHFAGTNIVGKNRDNIYLQNKNFLNLDSDMDIYSILKEADILITDYSSVYFDYLYLDRDIVFYPYDLEYYKNNDRGLLFNYDEMTPGKKVYNIDELECVLQNLRYKRDEFKDKRKEILLKCFEKYTLDDTVKNILNIK